LSYPIVLSISGASGAIYGKSIFDKLVNAGKKVELIITPTAESIIRYELGIDNSYFVNDNAVLHENSRFDTSIASGSFITAGMVIAPCSMGSLGRIASGVSSDLTSRVADVHLKEGRKLILVARESPLSAIHLENMLKLNRAGATILPASPSFYSNPASIEALIETVTARVFDQLGIENDISKRYSGKE